MSFYTEHDGLSWWLWEPYKDNNHDEFLFTTRSTSSTVTLAVYFSWITTHPRSKHQRKICLTDDLLLSVSSASDMTFRFIVSEALRGSPVHNKATRGRIAKRVIHKAQTIISNQLASSIHKKLYDSNLGRQMMPSLRVDINEELVEGSGQNF